MKYRIETLDTTVPGATWMPVHEGTSHSDAAFEFHWYARWVPPETWVRFSRKGMWPLKWEVQDECCGMNKRSAPQGQKEDATMADVKVEKRTPEPVREWFTVSGVRDFGQHKQFDFTRDEFRRIWEAGNKEFGTVQLPPGDWHPGWSCSGKLAEKDAEIARLKAENAHTQQGCAYFQTMDDALHEAKRLRGWIERWQRRAVQMLPVNGEADRALAGEKVPE